MGRRKDGSYSEGSPRVIIRIEPELLDLIQAQIGRSRLHRRTGQPHNVSTWLRQAAIDRLKHSARARGASTADLANLNAFPDEGV